MSAVEEARDAVCERIKDEAPNADADDLVKLAQAFSHVTYGPQGGDMDYSYGYDGTYHYHTHHHDERRPAGFGREDGFETEGRR